MPKIPASIRNNNPGAMWPGPSATKFGSTAKEQLTDSQRNQMAKFDTPIQGAAAQFDLLHRVYAGKTLIEALETWGGGNSPDAYQAVVTNKTGFARNARLTRAYIENPDTAIPFAKAMAWHEAGTGVDYPMSDADWKAAHDLAFSKSKPASLAFNVATDAPWLGILQDWERRGVREVAGPGSNPEIDEWFVLCGHPKGKFRDDTAHCAIGGYAALVMSGIDIPPASKNTMARSFRSAYPRVTVANVRPGDFRVMERGPAPYGHVDCVESVDREAGTCTVIGCNVDDAVTRRVRSLKGALGYVRPPSPAAKTQAAKPVTPRDLAPVSHKVSVLTAAMRWLQAAGAAIASVFTLDNLGMAQGVITDVKGVASDLALPAGCVLLVCALWLCRFLIRRIVEDYRSGHYVPSGEREA